VSAELDRFEHACSQLQAPFAVVDLDAMWSNADEMLRRSGHKPIRVASKSVRCRALLDQILGRDPRFSGLMTFTLSETLWLHEHGHRDLLLAYPTADRAGLKELSAIEDEDRPIVMVDSPESLDVIERLAPSGRGEFEITDVLNHYIPDGRLFTRIYEGQWADAGTVPSLLRAAELARDDDAAGRLAPPIPRPTA